MKNSSLTFLGILGFAAIVLVDGTIFENFYNPNSTIHFYLNNNRNSKCPTKYFDQSSSVDSKFFHNSMV